MIFMKQPQCDKSGSTGRQHLTLTTWMAGPGNLPMSLIQATSSTPSMNKHLPSSGIPRPMTLLAWLFRTSLIATSGSWSGSMGSLWRTIMCTGVCLLSPISCWLPKGRVITICDVGCQWSCNFKQRVRGSKYFSTARTTWRFAGMAKWHLGVDCFPNSHSTSFKVWVRWMGRSWRHYGPWQTRWLELHKRWQNHTNQRFWMTTSMTLIGRSGLELVSKPLYNVWLVLQLIISHVSNSSSVNTQVQNRKSGIEDSSSCFWGFNRCSW